MSLAKYPPIEHVRQCFRYDDGRLFWLQRPRDHFFDDRIWKSFNGRFAGKEAGSLGAGGPSYNRILHWVIVLDRKWMLRHIVVFALHHGEWVIGLDHRDRDPLNDRIDNLRIATQAQNNANTGLRSTNKSGFKGVFWEKRRCVWVARIQANGRSIHLGQFDYAVDAHAAYAEAAKRYFGEFACDGT